MAPVKRPSARAKLARRVNKAHKSSATSTGDTHQDSKMSTEAMPFSTFTLNKLDRRRMKHHALVNRISKASPAQHRLKRRRPSKNLAANLDGLLHALPEVARRSDQKSGAGSGAVAGDDDAAWEGISDREMTENTDSTIRQRKRADTTGSQMRMRTVNTRPGAMKRKGKAEMLERDRFAKNMAQMVSGEGSAGITGGAKMAALRAFIGQTREQNEAFSGN